MAAIPVVVTAPATVEGVNVARPTNSNGTRVGEGVLDHLVIAPAAAEPLFLSIWTNANAGTINADGVTATLVAATRRDVVPILPTTNIVIIGAHYPSGVTIRISTAADGTGNPAAAKVCSFRWT
jgi:hypothetical protein